MGETMGTLRATSILTGFFALTVPLMPVQAALIRLSQKGARHFPHWYHRKVCRLMGVRLSIEGAVASDRPVLQRAIKSALPRHGKRWMPARHIS